MRVKWIAFGVIIVVCVGFLCVEVFTPHSDTPPAAPLDAQLVSATATPQVHPQPAPTTSHLPTQQLAESAPQRTQPAPQPSAQPNVTLEAGSTTYATHIAATETVLALMQQLASTASTSSPQATSFTYAGTWQPSLGFFVDAINGVKNANSTYWFLYINGSQTQLGAAQQSVSPGDKVEWRYEK